MSAEGSKTQVIRDAESRDAPSEFAEFRQIGFAQRIHAADRERDPVQGDRSIRTHALQDVERASTAAHEILADRLCEISSQAVLQNRVVVGNPQPESDLGCSAWQSPRGLAQGLLRICKAVHWACVLV